VLRALGDQHLELSGSLLAEMAGVHYLRGRSEQVSAAAREALDFGRRCGDDNLCSRASSGLAMAHLQGLQLARALEMFGIAVVHAEHAGDLWTQGWPMSR